MSKQIEVLQEVGCINAELVVQLKGRVACEINSGDELIATECLFDNQLDHLDPAETVALLSALVFQQDASEPLLSPQLAAANNRCGAGWKMEELVFYFWSICNLSSKENGYLLSRVP